MSGTRPALRVFVDGSDWHEVTEGAAAPVRVRAADLQQAQALRALYRAQAAREGKDPDGIAVIVDLPVLLASGNREALAALAASGEEPSTLNYVGTVGGLQGLLADMRAVEVADGVTLSALAGHNDLDAVIAALTGKQAVPAGSPAGTAWR
ncbi:hypothetical protein [Amycolatopsis jejuensis]|uniref:hypothetical protein n=1 Tax=Amycolatopsis jejuensis TaxID=330084 RepID=UPI0005250A85|nr:hypothetical protein [Amycolatopsis jejuensis]